MLTISFAFIFVPQRALKAAATSSSNKVAGMASKRYSTVVTSSKLIMVRDMARAKAMARVTIRDTVSRDIRRHRLRRTHSPL